MGARDALVGRALSLAQTSASGRLIDLLERLDRSSAPRLTVLMYHRIDDPSRSPTLDPSLISTTPAEFERQMAYLGARRPVLSLADLLAIRRGERELTPGSVMVTFDDAYRDFAEHAWPTLRRHDIPVTLFVPTAFPDQPTRHFWWDRLHHALRVSSRREPLRTPAGLLSLATDHDRDEAFRALRDWIKASPHAQAMEAVDHLVDDLGTSEPESTVLGWDSLRELAEQGVVLAPHSRTHPLLHRLPLEEAQAEVLGSLSDLEREIGSPPRAFAFPGGGESDDLVRWLSEAGFEVAFATTRGGNKASSIDWLRLNRVNVGRRSSLPVIRAQLLSWAPGHRSSAPLPAS